MAISVNHYYTLICMLLLLPALCYGTSESYCSKATYYKAPDEKGTSNGACGYGEYGRYVNDGKVAAASWNLYKNGAGCGACYEVRCKDEELCSEKGVKVRMTDYGEGPSTDFIMSKDGYAKMAKHPKLADMLFSKGVVDVDYKRVSCEYGSLKIKIKECSNDGYLAIYPFNHGGYSDIEEVEIREENDYEWKPMRRSYGAVWDMPNPPKGKLWLKIKVNEDGKPKWVESHKTVIPEYRKPGRIHDTKMHIP